MLRTRNVQKFLRQRINRIMHGKTFPRILMILSDNRLSCQFRYAHNTIRIIHTVLFRCIYSRINLSAWTVEISCMNMNAKRFSTHHLCMHTSRICQPIVGMNNIKLLLASNDTRYNRKIIDLVMQVSRIPTGKLHTAQIIYIQIWEISIDMVTESIILLRRHKIGKPGLQIIIIDIPPYDRYLVHTYNIQETFFFTGRLRQTKSCLHIILQTQTFSNTIGCNRKTTVYFGRKFPSKH